MVRKAPSRGTTEPVRRTGVLPEPVLADALEVAALLDDEGRMRLRAALVAAGWTIDPDEPLEETRLAGVGDQVRRRKMREALTVALAVGWDVARVGSKRLGDLVPGAGLLPDGPLTPGAAGPRLQGVLDRAGWTRWAVLLDRSVSEVSSLANVGVRSVAELVGTSFERSLEGVATAWAHDPAADDLTVVLRHERGWASEPLFLALLEHRSSEEGPSRVREAADRLLRQGAPWAVDLGSAVLGLLHAAGDDRSCEMFSAWSSPRSPCSLERLAEEQGISGTRAGQIVRRVGSRLRVAPAASSGLVPWLASTLRRRLGPVATTVRAEEALARLGLDGAAGDLLLWLAGPYFAVPSRPGWLALEPREILRCTSSFLAADGGVRRLEDVETELGTPAEQAFPWLNACGAVVVHDLVVSLLGALPEVVERILDAHGRLLTVAEIAACLTEGGRTVADAALEGTLRGRRFRRGPDGSVGLADWGESVPSSKQVSSPRQPSRAPRKTPATVAPVPVPVRADVAEQAQEDTTAWLWVRVDADVLRGREAVVPGELVERMGVVSPSRRTFSSRYGPVVLAHDGPQPVRGSVRAVALAAGARDGDTMLLGFADRGDVTVEVRRGTGEHDGSPDLPPPTLFPDLVNGGTS